MRENIRIAAELGKIQSCLNQGIHIDTIIEEYLEFRENVNNESERHFFEIIVEVLEDYRLKQRLKKEMQRSNIVITSSTNVREDFNMKDCNCGYCMRGELLDKFGIEICDLEVSQLILFKEQSHPGRVIVAYKDHVSEIVSISDEERNLFMADVARAAKALHAAFHPKKVNYGAYGDTGCHLHMHLVPKYEDDPFEWGGVFAMNPDRKYLTEEEYAEMIEKIKANL